MKSLEEEYNIYGDRKSGQELKALKEIFAQIEKEQEMVDANKKLIEIFEQKIKYKISDVWQQ